MFKFLKDCCKDKNEQMRYYSLPPVTNQEVMHLISTKENPCWDVNNNFKCSKTRVIFQTVLDKKVRKDVQLHYYQYLSLL